MGAVSEITWFLMLVPFGFLEAVLLFSVNLITRTAVSKLDICSIVVMLRLFAVGLTVVSSAVVVPVAIAVLVARTISSRSISISGSHNSSRDSTRVRRSSRRSRRSSRWGSRSSSRKQYQ